MARPTVILDTSILIDLLRNRPEAEQWYQTLHRPSIGITSITFMEVIQGTRNRQQQHYTGRFLARFFHIHVLKQDSEWAMHQFQAYWLSHQIGIIDCFIAAVAVRLNVPLYTINIRDFEPLPNVNAIRPY